MKTFTVHFSPDSYVAHNEMIKDIGKIYIQLDDYAFPDKEWTDFGKVVVSWWMEEFRKLFSGEERKVQCKFMDGNYRFDVETTDTPQIWHVSFIREGANSEEVEEEGIIDAMQSTNELLHVVNEIKELYRKEGKTEYVKNADNFIQKFLLERQKSLVNAN